jgi:hypothetical protein
MKKNKSPLGYKMTHSPLNQNGDDKIVNSAGNDPELDKFLSGIHTIENPEYSPPEPAQSIEHDFFIKNRNTKSDSIAKVFINLDKQAKASRAKGESARESQQKINELLSFIKQENEKNKL